VAYGREVHAVTWLLSAAAPPPDLPIPENRTGPVVAALLAIAVVGIGVVIAGLARIGRGGKDRLSRDEAGPTTGRRRSR
jgi:hypothetical protein